MFSRRGGLYFGIAQLLDYPARYDQPIYRFAEFNAGQYASRNAAFQNAVSIASGVALELDGDLIVPGGGDRSRPGSTEAALRSLGARLGVGESEIRRALEQESRPELEQTRVYARVFELAEQAAKHALPRAVLPRVRRQSPKITRAADDRVVRAPRRRALPALFCESELSAAARGAAQTATA